MRFLSVFSASVLLLLASRALAATEPRDGFFQASDGVKIHYLTAGNPKSAGAPVILIHGFSGNAKGNWFTNGIADALAARHFVVAIDCRGHGQSDKPHDSTKYGFPRMGRDVIELMDHLQIGKAHVHGYSMGGAITAQLLATHPERFLTATFGGSGVQEVDAGQKEKVPEDKPGPDPQEGEARKKLSANPDRDADALAAVRAAWTPGSRTAIDLTKIKIPVLAINGEFDKPNAKTHRMQRELPDFRAVVLPGKSHLTAIMAGYIPPQYIDALVTFIDRHDPRS